MPLLSWTTQSTNLAVSKLKPKPKNWWRRSNWYRLRLHWSSWIRYATNRWFGYRYRPSLHAPHWYNYYPWCIALPNNEIILFENLFKPRQRFLARRYMFLTLSVLSTTSKQCFEQPATSFLVCSLIFIEYKTLILWYFPEDFRFKKRLRKHSISFLILDF